MEVEAEPIASLALLEEAAAALASPGANASMSPSENAAVLRKKPAARRLTLKKRKSNRTAQPQRKVPSPPSPQQHCRFCNQVFGRKITCETHEEACDLRPLSSRSGNAGRFVLVPRELWPDLPCDEDGGLGWKAVVIQSLGSRATCRFLETVAADEHLDIKVLRPIKAPPSGDESVNEKPLQPSSTELAPSTKASKLAKTPRAPKPPKPPKPLTGTSADVGRVVLVPAEVWPDEPCTEEEGRGWRAEVVAIRNSVKVQIRFLTAEAAEEWLHIKVLQPMSGRRPKGHSNVS